MLVLLCDVCRIQRAATCLPSSRHTAESTARPWFSAPVTAAGGESQSSDSCVSVAQSAAMAAGVHSDTSTTVRRRLADETLLDLTTPTNTALCLTLSDRVISPAGTPRPSLSRRTSDTLVDASSRPGSGRHAVLPPIRQLRSVDTVVTVGASTVVDVGPSLDE